MIDLKETYGKRYRVVVEESYEHETSANKTADLPWYYELIGKNGKLYVNSSTHLQLLLCRRLGVKLEKAMPVGWALHQNTDEGMVFILPNGDIGDAFKLLKPRKRRIGNPESGHRLAAYHFKSKSPDSLDSGSVA